MAWGPGACSPSIFRSESWELPERTGRLDFAHVVTHILPLDARATTRVLDALDTFDNDVRSDIDSDDLPFPKTPVRLPMVLSPDEVTRLIQAAPNLLYRTILMVLYETGIRRTEASLLKVSDIDSKRMVIHIRQGTEYSP